MSNIIENRTLVFKDRIIEYTIQGKLHWKELILDQMICSSYVMGKTEHLKFTIYLSVSPYMYIYLIKKNQLLRIHEIHGKDVEEIIQVIDDQFRKQRDNKQITQ